MKRERSGFVVAALAVSGALMLLVPIALAYPNASQFHSPSTQIAPDGSPGTGGLYATGSVRDKGVTCAHCHIKAEGKIGVTITTTPAWGKVGALSSYKPGTTYQFEVVLTGEHRGLDGQHPGQQNGMNLTVEDANGKTVGVYTNDRGLSSDKCPQTGPPDPYPGTTYVWGDCHGILFNRKDGNTKWNFSWRAPAAGTGALTIFYGVVDGDTGGSSSLDDDVKMGTIKLAEAP